MGIKHSRWTTALALAIAATVGASRADAVELLVSGNFETPGAGVGDIPGWDLVEYFTGSSDVVNSAELTGDTDIQLFLRAFEGGGPLRPAQANFDDDNLPAGDVDGSDFLTWQQNVGAANPTPSQGDADGDMMVNGADLAILRANFGRTPRYVNAVLSQTVPAAAGQTYQFQGTSTFEDNYSGFVNTLDPESPFGAIPSPTTNTFKMEFLDAGGSVIGTASRDLRTEQTFPGFPVVHTPVEAVAPTGTVNVRVSAESLNMAWNGSEATMGAAQSAFYNDFSLKVKDTPDELLTNGDLNLGPPDALDFWNQVENPATQVEILRTPIASFSNHTPGGSRGVWLSAFFGAHPSFEATPVDGMISQTVQAQEGATYTFSGWTKFEANYSGGVDTISASSTGTFAGQPSPTDTEIKLEFLDVNSVVIGSSVIDAKAARDLLSPTSNPNDNQWYQHTLAAVAPAGTRFARLTAQMIDGVFNTDTGGGQSAFFDDFSLDGPLVAASAVPEPSSLAMLAVGGLLVCLRGRRRIN